jgi:predicted nuclease of predicted toxin-antitoxin system
MRFLADHDVYAVTGEWLHQQGYNIVTAKDPSLQRAADEELLIKAKELDRLFLSRDKDFGVVVFLHAVGSSGVIFLRVTPTTVEEVHNELHHLLNERTEVECSDDKLRQTAERAGISFIGKLGKGPVRPLRCHALTNSRRVPFLQKFQT